MILTGQNLRTGRKFCPSATLPPKKWHGQIWERTRGLRTERPSDNHLVNFNNGVQVNVIGKLNSCLTGNTICLEHTHEHTLMRYETTAFVVWIINALLGREKKQKFFSQSKWHTHDPTMLYTINYNTTVLTRNVRRFPRHSNPLPRSHLNLLRRHPSGRRKRKTWPRVEPTWRQGGVSGKRRGYTGRYAKQFNWLLCAVCLWAIVTVNACFCVYECN
jgi:hypothetical protein